MDDLAKISNSFNKTLKDSNLHNIATNIAEPLVDSIMTEGLLKDIPILGTILSIAKSGINIGEMLLIKKILYFLYEIKEIDESKRVRMIDKIDNSDKYKIKVSEKLLYIIDKSEDHIKSKYHAKLFKAFINEEISYPLFLRSTSIIQKMIVEDIQTFLSINKWYDRHTTHKDVDFYDFDNSLIGAGICFSETTNEPITVRDQDQEEAYEQYIVNGGETTTCVQLTHAGEKIKEVLLKYMN